MLLNGVDPTRISRYKQEQQRGFQHKEKTDEISSYID